MGSDAGAFADGRKLRAFNLPERWMEIEDPKTQRVSRLTFDYVSEGANISSLVTGPDGRIYGSTNHPMHFFVYDPDKDKLENLGPIRRIGGGNICAMAVQGKMIVGGAYSGGWLYLYDTTKPFNGETGDDPNPRLVASYKEDICRPRTALAHPDGRHVIIAGFMGYGRSGGGLAIHDLVTGQNTLIQHHDLIPDQSTITLKALPDGDLVGGTSVETPGGGHSEAKEGVLYVMDWKTKKVVFQTVPVPGAREVFSIEVGSDGMVFGLASGSEFFVFDSRDRRVVHRERMAQYGGLPRPALMRTAHGKVIALFTRAIVEIGPRTYQHTKIADTPAVVTAGSAIHKGRLYFAVGSHLLSCRIEE